MPNAQHLRAQIEADLSKRIPSALTPLPRVSYPVVPTGILEIDALLHGGLPVGAISEIVGPDCSGRTSLALTFAANLTQSGKVCAWVDVSDTLHAESAAAIGVDLSRLLWVRCGASPNIAPLSFHTAKKTPRTKPATFEAGGGHPRMEAKGLSTAVSDLLGAAPCNTEALRKARPQPKVNGPQFTPFAPVATKTAPKHKNWARLEQGLRVTDLLLQAGGFSCIVLDMGSLNAEYALRVPLATWFRFRAAAERLQANVLLLTQHACSRNSAGLVLHLAPGSLLRDDTTIFTGVAQQAELSRHRFPHANVFPLRKQPQSVQTAQWQASTVWIGSR